MKKILSMLLIVVCFVSLAVCAYGDSAASTARAVIGADLTEEQIASVYNMFGMARYSVPELTMTNDR